MVLRAWDRSLAALNGGRRREPIVLVGTTDAHRFGEDGSFCNIMDDETWIESWQGGDVMWAPVAPHDGSSTGIYIYDQDESTLTIEGKGSHIALPKAVNGEELGSVGDTPDSIVYQILELDNDRLTVTLESGPGVWWTFRLKKVDGSNNDSSNEPVNQVRSGDPLVSPLTWTLSSEGALQIRFTDSEAVSEITRYRNYSDGSMTALVRSTLHYEPGRVRLVCEAGYCVLDVGG